MDSLLTHVAGMPADETLIDAYSSAVSGAVAAAHPAVVHIEVRGSSTPKAAKAVGLPEDFVALTLVIVGRPGDGSLLSERQVEAEKAPRQRKDMAEVAFHDRYSLPPQTP